MLIILNIVITDIQVMTDDPHPQKIKKKLSSKTMIVVDIP